VKSGFSMCAKRNLSSALLSAVYMLLIADEKCDFT
jgi:hypothetical protein